MKKLIVITLLIFANMQLFAQKEEIKDVKKPLVFVNGKKFDFPISLIDTKKIVSISIIKGKEAIEKYNSSTGVIFLKTKILKDKSNKVRIKGSKLSYLNDKIKLKLNKKKSPKIIIDGKVSTKKELNAIMPEGVEKIEVLKGKKAKKHNAPNGVIIITTKK